MAFPIWTGGCIQFYCLRKYLCGTNSHEKWPLKINEKHLFIATIRSGIKHKINIITHSGYQMNIIGKILTNRMDPLKILLFWKYLKWTSRKRVYNIRFVLEYFYKNSFLFHNKYNIKIVFTMM